VVIHYQIGYWLQALGEEALAKEDIVNMGVVVDMVEDSLVKQDKEVIMGQVEWEVQGERSLQEVQLKQIQALVL
tara:strand:+ start:202 stop:423 length:222 start_codon:yes stop_codon:yes gene_type:complete